MKKYEKPSVDIKKFEVEDVMTVSTYSTNNDDFKAITGDGETRNGVVFQW